MKTVCATYLGKGHKVGIGATISIEKLLKKMGINPEIVIVSVNGEITPDNEKVKAGDKVEIIKVVSGG